MVEPESRSDRSSIPAYIWPLILAGLTFAFFATLDARTLFVTVPLTVGLLVTTGFLWVLWRRRLRSIPWFEIGAVYVAVAALYMVYPLVAFLALGKTYTPLNDTRLYMMQPEADEIGRIAWLYACHLMAFAGVYLLVRGRLPRQGARFTGPRFPVLVAVVIVYLSIEAFSMFLGLFYNTSADTYVGTYLVARRLPLVFAQLLNHLSGVKYVLSLMLLAALFSRYPASKPVIAGWFAIVGVMTMAKLGSRTELVLLILSAAMMYDTVVRPIRPRVLIAISVVGLLGFITFGAVRNNAARWGAPILNPFAYANEFENLFSNAVHLDSERSTIGPLPIAFYVADFAALVPQQFVPFTKIDRAAWYVNMFFPDYAARGGGLAFGTVAESVLTGGWPSALVAGAALGFCFAKIHRLYVRRPDSFWTFVMYVWVTTLCYQSFRNSTFALLVLFAYRFVPAVLLVTLLSMALRPATSRARPSPSPGVMEA